MLVNLEAERVRLQLTRRELADRVGIGYRTYFNYIHEYAPMPAWVLLAFAKLFRCSADYLLESEAEHERI